MAASDQLIMRNILSSLKDVTGDGATSKDKAIAGLAAIGAISTIKDSKFRDIVMRRVTALIQ